MPVRINLLLSGFLLLLIPFHGCHAPQRFDSVASSGYRLTNIYPHDSRAFTEGLVFFGGFLYEGTGLSHGIPSSLRKVDLKSGEIMRIHELKKPLFGEGITILGNEIIQLTYRSQLGFVYERDNFKSLREFHYPTEGWGITHDGQYLIMSNGSSRLYYLDPVTYKGIKQIEVYDDHGPLSGLNELEYIKGEVYANVFGTSTIVRIGPETGQVTGAMDLSILLDGKINNPELFLQANGIAYNPVQDRLYITGKLWPQLFELEILEK